MSYAIIRIQKFFAAAVGGIQIHDKRVKQGVSHTNQDIDWTRTHLNYDLSHKENDRYHEQIRERIQQLNLKKAVRKDAVVMAQVLVTSDRSFFDGLTKELTREFFQESYHRLVSRYGAENIISATIHMDERTPHMHFNFVPVTPDGRLSAKSIFTRQSLIEQQDLFVCEVAGKYGLHRGKTGVSPRRGGAYDYSGNDSFYSLDRKRRVCYIHHLEKEITALTTK